MGRTLSGASYDRNDYVLQPHNGGSGCASIEELKERYGLIRPNEFNIPGGVLAYDENGNVPVASLPSQLLTRPTTYIKGPVSIVPGGTATYSISNYSESTSYNVSFDGGSVSIVGDTITIVAGNTAGNYTLVINNEKYELAISSQAPHDVHMTVYPFRNSTDTFTIFKIDVEGVFSNDSGHFATDYQIATDKGFNNLISNVEMSVNKNSIRITAPKVQTYFVRARVIDNYKQKSDWSEVFTIDLENIGADIATPQSDVSLYKDGNNIVIRVNASEYYSDSDAPYGYLTVKVCSDPGLTTVVSSVNITDPSQLNDLIIQSAASNLYVTTRYTSSTGKNSGWTKTQNFVTSDLFGLVPTVTEQLIENPFNNNDVGISNFFGGEIFYDEVNDEVLISAIKASEQGNNSGRVALYERRNNKWQLKQTFSDLSGQNELGRNIDVSDNGNVLIISSGNYNGISSGYVNVYYREDNLWVKKSTINGPVGETTGSFGKSISTNNDGSIIAVSQSAYNSNAGRVYIFTKNGETYSSTFIDSPDNQTRASFGIRVALSANGTKLAITAPLNSLTGGALYLYTFNGTVWQLTQTVTGLSVDSRCVNMGYTMSCTPDLSRIVLNDRYYTPEGATEKSGAVIVLDMVNNALVYNGTVTHFDKNPRSLQTGIKSRISPDGNTLYYAAGDQDGEPGHILVFKFENNVWVFKDSINAPNGHNKSKFGGDLAIDTRAGNLFVTDFVFGNNILDGSSSGDWPGVVYYMRPQNKRFEKIYSVFCNEGAYTPTSQIKALNDGKYILVSRNSWKITTDSPYTGALFIYKRVNGRYSFFQRLDASTEPTRFNAYFQNISPVPGKDKFAVGTAGTISGGQPIDFYAYDSVSDSFKKTTESILVPLIDGVRGGYTGENMIFSSDGNSVLIEQWGGSSASLTSGSVYYYKLENGSWVLKQTVANPDIPGGNVGRFGTRLRTIKDIEYLFVTGLLNGVNGTFTGPALITVYRLKNGLYEKISTLLSTDYGVPSTSYANDVVYSETSDEVIVQSSGFTATKTSCSDVFSLNGDVLKYKYTIYSGAKPGELNNSILGTFGYRAVTIDKYSTLCITAVDRYAATGSLEFFKYKNGKWVYSHEVKGNQSALRGQCAVALYNINNKDEVLAVCQSGGRAASGLYNSSFFVIVS